MPVKNSIAIYVAKVPVAASTTDTPEPLATALQGSWLSEVERERVMRFRFLKDQQLSLASKQITRTVIGHELECEPQSLNFAQGPHGKPFLPDYPSLKFNLSHTANTVVLAVAHSSTLHALGVDVELPMPDRGSYKLAKRFFCADETEQLTTCQPWESNGLECFNQFWTLKESFIKGLGTGLRTPLGKFGFDLRQPGKIGFHCDHDIDCGPLPWHFATYHFDAKTRIALGFQAEHATYDIRLFKITNYLPTGNSHTCHPTPYTLMEIPINPTAKSWDA